MTQPHAIHRLTCLVTFILAFALAGCSSEAEVPVEETPERFAVESVTTVRLANADALTPDERQRLTRRIMDARRTTRSMLDEASSWAEADADVRAHIATLAEGRHVDALAGHIALVVLQSRWMTPGEAMTTRREAVAHYTDLALTGGQVDPVVLAPALRALRGTWTDERLAAATDRALAAAAEAKRDVTDAPKVLASGAQQDAIEAAFRQKNADRAAALDRLQTLRADLR
jgi:hypothetical protein